MAAHTNASTPLDVRRGLTDPKDINHTLRWGILGAGNISSQWVDCLKAVPGAQLTAVGARTLDRAQAFATRHGIESAYGNYDALVSDPNVDIVYVGTITRLHHDHSLLALNAGKHVLCEKPLASNSEEAREMYGLAKAKGLFFQDAMWTRFFPAVEHARFLIENGDIGDVLVVHSDFFDPIYVIQAAPLGFGHAEKPRNIAVAGKRAAGAIVEYGENKCAMLSFPPFNCELPETTELIGTKGRITLGHPAHCPTEITVRIPPENGVPSRYRTRNAPAPAHRFEYPIPGHVRIPAAFPNQHGFLYQAEAVHRCIAAGLTQCPQYDEQESMHCMDILAEVQRLRSS